jgi:hypothetical protein
MLELERNGFDVGAERQHKVGVRSHRVVDPEDATAHIHLVAGEAIERYGRQPGQELVVRYDPRNAEELVEFEQLKQRVSVELRRRGLDDLALPIEHDNLAVAFDPRVPRDLIDDVARLLDLGLPVAVFVGPPPT